VGNVACFLPGRAKDLSAPLYIVILTDKAARAYREIGNLCPFYTTRKILPEELKFRQYLNKDSIQILSSQMESQNDRKNSSKIYTGNLASAICNDLHKYTEIIKELNY